VDDFRVTKSEDGLIVHVISFQDFQTGPPTSDRRTDKWHAIARRSLHFAL